MDFLSLIVTMLPMLVFIHLYSSARRYCIPINAQNVLLFGITTPYTRWVVRSQSTLDHVGTHMRYDGAKVIYIDSFNAETQCPESRPKYFFFIFSLSIGDHKTFKKSKYISRQYK